jgi:polygalacturonase
VPGAARPWLLPVGASLVLALLTFVVACQVNLDTGAAPAEVVTLRPEQFGAVGDGRADDTTALQNALDALAAGQALKITEGRTFRHTSVLRIRHEGVRVEGPGTLLATNEASSAVVIQADRVTVAGHLVLKMGPTTKRWSGHNQMKLRISGHTGVVVRDITVDGSAAAGIYVEAADHFTISDVIVKETRADGIHMTNGARDGQVIRPHVIGTGDDGVAVVSYTRDQVLVRGITVDAPVVENGKGGRGVTVVGGDDITFKNVKVTRSSAAAVYVATEGDPYYTYAPRRIRVLGGTLSASNTKSAADHGAVLVYSGRSGYTVDDVVIDGLTIVDTRTDAPWQVGAIGPGGFSNITLTNLAISDGPSRIFRSDAGRSATTSGWTLNGKPYAPRPW